MPSHTATTIFQSGEENAEEKIVIYKSFLRNEEETLNEILSNSLYKGRNTLPRPVGTVVQKIEHIGNNLDLFEKFAA